MTLRMLGVALLVGVLLPGLFVAGVRLQSGPTALPPPAGVLADFALEDQEGRLTQARELRGRPVVVTFFFTTCTTVCPVSAAHLVRLQQALATEDVAFVSFSIDPERDGRAVRLAYAERWAPEERRWHLLAPSAEDLAAIAFSLGVNPRTAGDVHTTSMFLVGADGRLLETWTPETPLTEQVAAVYSALRASEHSVREDGPTLYRRLGCGGCHHEVDIAPDLRSIGPRTRGELREALLSPSLHVAAGYADTMPSYAGVLSEEQLGTLTAWLSAPSAPSRHIPTGGVHAPITTIDPVCGMEVHPSDHTPHSTIGGRDHWFCSEFCLQAYLDAPDRHTY